VVVEFEPSVEALVFDVFGTVVDWRTSVVRELGEVAAEVGASMEVGEIEALADEWRAGYGAGTREVESGELGWRTVDELHRSVLDRLLVGTGLEGLSEERRGGAESGVASVGCVA
jgi:2-haloacid dehalogenase